VHGPSHVVAKIMSICVGRPENRNPRQRSPSMTSHCNTPPPRRWHNAPQHSMCWGARHLVHMGGSANGGSGRVDGGKGDVAQRRQMKRTTVNQGHRGQQRRGSCDEPCTAQWAARCVDEAGEQGISPPGVPISSDQGRPSGQRGVWARQGNKGAGPLASPSAATKDGPAGNAVC
jgi:hypothetical protein